MQKKGSGFGSRTCKQTMSNVVLGRIQIGQISGRISGKYHFKTFLYEFFFDCCFFGYVVQTKINLTPILLVFAMPNLVVATGQTITISGKRRPYINNRIPGPTLVYRILQLTIYYNTLLHNLTPLLKDNKRILIQIFTTI